MSEVKEKVESELKTVKSLCETIEHAIKSQIDRGLESVDTHELYEAVDIYKDLSEVKKNIVKTCYYMQIMEAMEDSEYGEDYDENGKIEDRRYYNSRRYANGRYAPKRRGTVRGYEDYYPLEHYRDMDRMVDGRMYFTDGYNHGKNESQMMNTRDYREGRSGQSRRSYMEVKDMNDNSTDGKQKKINELEKYMNELSNDVTEMITGASVEEKNLLKQKLTNLSNKIV